MTKYNQREENMKWPLNEMKECDMFRNSTRQWSM